MVSAMDVATRSRLQALVPDPGHPVRVPPVGLRQLGPLAAVVAWGSGRVLGSAPAHIFRVLGQHRSLFRWWLRYSGKLMPGGTLPRADAEVVILRVAWRTGAAYEWHQHVVMGARAGLPAADIERCASEDITGFTARQVALVRGVDELLAVAQFSEDTFTALSAELDGAKGLIEFCLLVGQYQGLATALGGLGVQLER